MDLHPTDSTQHSTYSFRSLAARAALVLTVAAVSFVPLSASHSGASIPEPPTSVMASYDEYKSYIRITWDRMDEATHYRILRNVDGAWLEVANNVKIGKDFNFGLYWDQPYENETLYGVQACNGAGCSDVNTHDCGSTMPGSI